MTNDEYGAEWEARFYEACEPKREKPDGKQLAVHDADRVKAEPVEWLWPGRIAIGKTALLGGDPGLGKSQLSIFIASVISQAGEWPCKEGRSPKRSVIMLSAEDGVADTIVPRLMAVPSTSIRAPH